MKQLLRQLLLAVVGIAKENISNIVYTNSADGFADSLASESLWTMQELTMIMFRLFSRE